MLGTVVLSGWDANWRGGSVWPDQVRGGGGVVSRCVVYSKGEAGIVGSIRSGEVRSVGG